MNKSKLTCIATLMMLSSSVTAQTFEDAFTAVANMRVGWNLGNTLDSNSGGVDNMWLEAWSDHTPKAYETAWGQPVTTRELIHMFKEAGFNAIRVPVTWYGHFGKITINEGFNDQGEWKAVWDMDKWTGYDIDPAWMARVHEIVDYVIDEGMYCILNVHHDTGEASTAWLRADEKVYTKQKARFEALWTAIATEFVGYDQHLVFEGYNEMLDSYGSWCYASFAAPGNYNATVATSAYNAINSYAQSFVNAVRATGGNNAERNLIVTTYGACNGEGTWNQHLIDPVKYMEKPKDTVDNHIIFEVHFYPDITDVNYAKKVVDTVIGLLNTNLVSKGAPVIFGEWGTLNSNFANYSKNIVEFAEYMVKAAKAAGMGTFYWMGLSDGSARSVPKWSEPDLKDAIIKGYYGDIEGITDITVDDDDNNQIYNILGQPVNEISTPGIYIKGNKKYIIR